MKKKNVVNIIAFISMLGVFFGTMAMIIVLSVFNGFDRIIQDLYYNIDPDIKIELKEGILFNVDRSFINQINEIEGVISCVEILEYKMLARYGENQLIVDVKGVGSNYPSVTNLDKHIILGKGFNLESNFLVIGSGVFHNLSLQLLDFEKPLELSFFNNLDNISIQNSINTHSFYVNSVFSTQVEIDNSHVFIDIHDLRNFLDKPQECSSLALSIQNGVSQRQIIDEIELKIGKDFLIKNRFQQRPFVNKMVRTEKLMVYIIFTFILVISMLSLIASLVVLLMEKQKDIQVLYFLGMGFNQIENIFLIIGMVITSLGLFLGSFMGVLLCVMQDKFELVKLGTKNHFFIDSYPVQINLGDIFSIQIIVLLLGFIASYFISRKKNLYPNV